MIRVEFDETIPRVPLHKRKVWFTVNDSFRCVADLQFDIVSKLICPYSKEDINRIYMSLDGYTLLPCQNLSTLLQHQNPMIRVSIFPEFDESNKKRQTKKRRRKHKVREVLGGKSADYTKAFSGDLTCQSDLERAELNELSKSKVSVSENGDKKAHRKVAREDKLSDSEGASYACTSSTKHIRFDDDKTSVTDGDASTELMEPIIFGKENVIDASSGHTETLPHQISASQCHQSKRKRSEDESDCFSDGGTIRKRGLSTMPAWVMSALSKNKEKTINSKQVLRQPANKPHHTAPPCPPLPPPPEARTLSCPPNKPPPPTAPYPVGLNPQKNKTENYPNLSKTDQDLDTVRIAKHCRGDEHALTEEDPIEMGFETLRTPGREKRPYAVIVSHGDRESLPECCIDITEESYLKVPVPRYYKLQVGERIAYTMTTLDEANWEPVVSSPTVASIIKVVDSVTQETAGNDAPPESVSYVLSSTTNDDDAYYVRWADITECWVLRKPNNDFNPPPHFSSMSRQESFALHNFLERIDSKRSQLTGDIMSD